MNTINKTACLIKKNDFEEDKKMKLSGFLFETSQFKTKLEKKEKNKNLGEIIFELKNSIKEEKEIRLEFRSHPIELRKNLIEQFEKIQNLSQKVLDKIWMASEEELKIYSKQVDISNLLNSFSKKFKAPQNPGFLVSNKRNSILINSSNSNNSFLKLKHKNNLKISKNELAPSIGMSGYASMDDSMGFNHSNANITFNNIFSNHIKAKNQLFMSNAIEVDPILGRIDDLKKSGLGGFLDFSKMSKG